MRFMKPWLQNARMAALLTVNLDGEQFWLGMFPDAVRRPKTLSMGEYGIVRGLDRVLRAFREYGIHTTFFVPGAIAEKHPDAIEKILNDGHELALQGYSHTSMHLLTPEQQEEELLHGKEVIFRAAGYFPVGFRAPEGELTHTTMNLAAKCGFLYSSSLYDHQYPYEYPVDEGHLIEIPMNWSLHDFPYLGFNYGPAFPSGQGRIASYQTVQENYEEEFDAYLAEGGVYVAQFTPQSIGSPGKIQILEHILAHVEKHRNEIWIGRCRDLLSESSRQ